MKMKVGVSNRHLHLCKEDFDFFFSGEEFYSVKDLNQKGEFMSNLFVDLKTEKDIIEHVRVVGPLRSKTQVEISKTDAYKLGVNPEIRMSGDLENTESITVLANGKEKTINSSLILSHRHIHANFEDLQKYGLKDGGKYKIIIDGPRGGVLNNVLVKAKDTFTLEVHIDTDEANTFGLKSGDEVEVVEED